MGGFSLSESVVGCDREMTSILPPPYSGVPLTTTPVVVKDSAVDQRTYPEHFVPETEVLDHDETRVTALGTGYPARPAQACSGFLIECGNGSTFIFDAGPGTNSKFNTLRIPYWRATRFFITHFHLDHISDLPVYYDFGQMSNRLEPMHIHGPTGAHADESAESIVAAIRQLSTWHDRAKRGLDPRVYDIIPHGFDASETNIVYDQDGVTVTAFPVPHAIFGAVGYRLDYAGLSVVYSGDSEPSTITVENAKGVDLLIHEVFNQPETYMEEMGWTEVVAKTVVWTMHTAPEAAAEVFKRSSPRMAMGHHAIVMPGSVQPIADGVRLGYEGPFTLAQDYTVVNITPSQIVTRMAEVNLWSVIAPDADYVERMGGSVADPDQGIGLPDWLTDTVIKTPIIEERKAEFLKKLGS